MDFFKFPRTPHLTWLDPGQPRDDKVLSPLECEALLNGEIVVEEKVDGANLGFSVAPNGRVRVQNRGAYLRRGCHPQFDMLWAWLAPRETNIAFALGEGLIIFGEWCFAVHSVRYDRLPDWFLGFDVYDCGEHRFMSTGRRDTLFASVGIVSVPTVARGRFDIHGLRERLEQTDSQVGSDPVEGLYLRRENKDWLLDRAKLVRATFIRDIDVHWSRQSLKKNSLASCGGMNSGKDLGPK